MNADNLYGVFGFANTGVREVQAILHKKTSLKVSYFSDTETPLPKDAEVVLVSNSAYLTTVIEHTQHLDGYVLVLFDVPVRLDGIKGLIMADVAEKKKSFYYEFEKPNYPKIIRLINEKLEAQEPFPINLRKPNVIPTLLKSTASSTLQRLQSWKYAIKPVSLRDEAMTLVFNWFINEKLSQKWLEREVDSLLEKEGATKTLFADDRYHKLKAAVLTCLKAKEDGKSIVSQVAEKEKLSAFDIRYIMNAATVSAIYEDQDIVDIYQEQRKAHTEKNKDKQP